MAMFYALFAFCLSGSALAIIVQRGNCPDIETMPNFDINKYLGTWYEVEKYMQTAKVDSKCTTLEFTRDENDTVRVVNDHIVRMTGVQMRIPGTLEPSHTGDTGKLDMIFPSLKMPTTDFWILDTDYESYSVVYVCKNGTKNNHYMFVRIYTRERKPSESVIAKYVEVTEKHHFKRYYFWNTKQEDCVLRPSK